MPARTALLSLAALAGTAAAQAEFPAIFVANNGNLEGSVSTMRIEADGSLTFVSKVVTGTRSSTSQPCPGCNTYAIDITPDGRFLATAHAAGSSTENLTVYAVAPDGSLTVVEELPLAQGGLDIQWINNELLALPLTDLSLTNRVRLFRLDEDNQLTEIDSAVTGSFNTSIAVHPNRRWLYANDSLGSNTVRVFDTEGGSLTLIQTLSLPNYGVAIEVDPSGQYLYAAGGISNGGNSFAGYAIDPADGSLSPLAGSPYTSPGASPKGFAFSEDSDFLYVSHGTDATIRGFSLDPDGIPTSTGFSFDVGLQGSLREMNTLGNLLFALDETTAIDGVRGAYSFTIDPSTGNLTPLPGSPVDTQGISPNDVVAWAGANPACNPADLAAPFGVLDLADVQAFVGGFLAQDAIADLAPPAGVFDLADVQVFVSAFNAGCP
tara:strand:+ start:69 stop:1373 length:1305 start_codon:yes stop_codon:yes gene_type:complete